MSFIKEGIHVHVSQWCENHVYRVRKKINPLAKGQYLRQNSIFWLDFLGVCRGDNLASNLQIWIVESNLQICF